MRCKDCLKKHGSSKEGLTHIFTCAVCGKRLDEDKKPEAVLSNSTDGLKRLVIAMLQEVQDKDLCDCINDEHLNLDHHVLPTLK